MFPTGGGLDDRTGREIELLERAIVRDQVEHDLVRRWDLDRIAGASGEHAEAASVVFVGGDDRALVLDRRREMNALDVGGARHPRQDQPSLAHSSAAQISAVASETAAAPSTTPAEMV